MSEEFSFSADIWLWSNGRSPASWHFVTVEKKVSDSIADATKEQARKWRWSVKVKVRIWFYDWTTSIFPDKKLGCYLLPIKREAREQLQVGEGDRVWIVLELL